MDCVKETLQQVDSLLKPGGHVYFMEHIASKKGTWKRMLQDLVNPFWVFVRAGCNCNRDSLELMKEHTDWDIISWNYRHMTVVLGTFVLGLAMKKKTT